MKTFGPTLPVRVVATCINTLAFLAAGGVAFAHGHPGIGWTGLVVAIILALFTVA